MKDTLILEHRIYISVKRAAQISGYVSDYIGQLCRDGKLECRRVGKAWFLTEESLLNHRLLSDQKIPNKTKVQLVSPAPKITGPIILDRKNYISAKRAAEISGYTQDYVGQLCRIGKLESKRVGKDWFVSEQSLLDHCVDSAKNSNVNKIPQSISAPALTPNISAIANSKSIPTVASVLNSKSDSISKSSFSSSAYFQPATLVDQNITTNTNLEKSVAVQKKTSKYNFIYLLKLSAVLGVLIIILVSFIQSIFISPKYNVQNETASVYSGAKYAVSFIFDLFSSIPKLAINIFGSRSNELAVTSSDQQVPEFDGIAVVPSSNSSTQYELMKEKIKSTFSDEVKVKTDSSGTAGVITPVFKKVSDDDFVYVLVPVKN